MRLTNSNVCNTNTICAGADLSPCYLSGKSWLSMHAAFQQLPLTHTITLTAGSSPVQPQRRTGERRAAASEQCGVKGMSTLVVELLINFSSRMSALPAGGEQVSNYGLAPVVLTRALLPRPFVLDFLTLTWFHILAITSFIPITPTKQNLLSSPPVGILHFVNIRRATITCL